MTRPTLEIVAEDAGLYAIACDTGEALGVIGPLDDREALMIPSVERWPNVDNIDLRDTCPQVNANGSGSFLPKPDFA